MESTPPTANGSNSRVRTMAAAILLSFVVGAVLAFYLAWSNGWVSAPEPDETEAKAVPAADLQGNAELAAAAPSTEPVPTGKEASLDMRLAALERRLNRLDLQAEAASGHAARAEGLLVAFAARRLLERGAPLGYLENQLQLRFGNAQPNAVRTIINGSRNPVTLESLRLGLEKMSAKAVEEPATVAGWERVKSELANLFILRSSDAPSPQPEVRLDRARLLLDDGRVEAAAALVERLPNSEGVAPWLGDARRYIAIHDALDLIETAALLEPRQLIDGEGQPVRQSSPAAPSPSPSATNAGQ